MSARIHLLRDTHPPALQARVADAFSVLEAGLAAVDPAQAVRAAVRRDGPGRLCVGERAYDLDAFDRILLVGAGKAGAPMAAALAEVLGERLSTGLVTVKYGHRGDFRHPRVQLREAGHPWPDEAGFAATREILALLEGATERDLVFVVISGGGSALLEAPVEGLGLEDLRALTTLLLRAGADIRQVNAVRKHLSRVKAGQLARAAAPATVVGLILSDVVGAPLDSIASGPTAPDGTTFEDAWRVLEGCGLVDGLPAGVRRHLEAGRAGAVRETPKAGDACFAKVQNLVVAGIAHAVEAAAGRARALGYAPLILTSTLEGEAREVAKVLCAVAREARESGRPIARPAALLAGGETTVTLRGDGKGGRNQELALAATLALEGLEDVLLVSLATDGTDGPTDAAGGLATGGTAARARAQGLEPVHFLARNDAYRFFEATGDLVVTGPTRTNVCDLVLALVW